MRPEDRAKLLAIRDGGEIPVITTSVYPTRYAAFDNPGSLVIYRPVLGEDPERGEIAVYHLPMPNVDWAGIVDGVYAEVHPVPRPKRGPKQYRVEVQSTRPDASRLQHVSSIRLSEAEVMASVAGWPGFVVPMIRAMADTLCKPTWEAIRQRADELEAEAAGMMAGRPPYEPEAPSAWNTIASLFDRAKEMRSLADQMARGEAVRKLSP